MKCPSAEQPNWCMTGAMSCTPTKVKLLPYRPWLATFAPLVATHFMMQRSLSG